MNHYLFLFQYKYRLAVEQRHLIIRAGSIGAILTITSNYYRWRI